MTTDSKISRLSQLTPSVLIVFGGNRQRVVGPEIAEKFQDGDELFVLQDSGDLLHIPSGIRASVDQAVSQAATAFEAMPALAPSSLRTFYAQFATQLEDSTIWQSILEANQEDVVRAEALGRSTTRLTLDQDMRSLMIDGLREWERYVASPRPEPDRIEHDTWTLFTESAPLGVIAFVFEGRPNVFVDAVGVLAVGNTAVMRIGGDALSTATAIEEHALKPALRASDIPVGAVSLIDSRERSAGWALFSDRRIALAVTRGSGKAVQTLSAVAHQSGIPVSAHGTGGAWLVADDTADPNTFAQAVQHSLDRKVCNTMNTLVIVESRSQELVPLAIAAADQAASQYGRIARVHVVETSQQHLDPEEYQREIVVKRADGLFAERRATTISVAALGTELLWEENPEFNLVIVRDLDEAIGLFNQYSPQFVASLLTGDEDRLTYFRARVNAPFVGNGFTRWVDGQYALGQPELGLSNWENGRLLGRSGILTPADVTARRVYTLHRDPGQRR